MDVPGRRLRGARGRRGGRAARRPDRQPLELRAVRRDHRQGRPPHARPRAATARSTRSRSATPRRSACVKGRVDAPRAPRSPPASCSPAAAAARGRVRPARRRACPALDPLDRSATFEARARAVAAATRMQVRFTLQVREDDARRLAPRRRPGLRHVARRSDPGRAPLHATPGPSRTWPRRPPTGPSCASAGSTTTARWSSGSRRTSAACRQPDLRPNLVAARRRRRAGPHRGRAPLRRHACATRARATRARSPSGCASATRSSTRRSCAASAPGGARS